MTLNIGVIGVVTTICCVVSVVAIDAVPCSDPVNPPVDTVEPVTTNPCGKDAYPMSPLAIDAVSAKLAVPMNEPENEPVLIWLELDTTPLGRIVGANDALVANEAVAGVNVMLVAADAVVAKDDDIAFVAQLLVPNNEPVNPPVDSVDPVTVNPFGKVM
jgi:hypothetical protein